MGVKGLWPLIRKKGYNPTPIQLPCRRAGTLRLDLQGTFYPLLQRAFSRPPEIAYEIIHHTLLEVIDQTTAVVYIDGYDTEEKRQTHDDRDELRLKATDNAMKAMDKLQDLLHEGKPAKKQLHVNVRKNMKKAFRLKYADRVALGENLASRGWNVRVANGEADLEIARDCDHSTLR